jgi:hypothetical protein
VTFQNGGEILHDFTVQQGLTNPVTILDELLQRGLVAAARVLAIAPGLRVHYAEVSAVASPPF